MNSIITNGLFSILSPQGKRGRLTVLLFHKIPSVTDPLTPTEMCLDRFEHILDFLKETSNVLPLEDATEALTRGQLPRNAVALTFDDGYAEWLANISPALHKRNFPATFFVTTEQLSGSALWHERIIAAVRALPDHHIFLPFGFGNYDDLSTHERRISLVRELQERLKYVPLHDRLSAIELLEKQAVTPIILPGAFNAASVRALHSQGFEIGAHTIRHPILNECTDEEAKSEIGGCREELEAIIRGKVNLFAYPNGRPQKDYSDKHVTMVKSCGYKAAVATSGGAAGRSSDIYQLPRFSPWGKSSERISYQLIRNMFTSEKRAQPISYDKNKTQTTVKCLLVANTFPPIHGGSAVVYENLCMHMPAESIRVLTAKKSHLNNQEIEGWQQYDTTLNFPVDRVDLLRPLMARPPANIFVSLYRLIFQDLPLYIQILLAASRIVYLNQINTVCIGELVTGSWLGIALRTLFGTKLIIYVHGEEVTTVTGGRLNGNRRKRYLAAADKVIAVSSFTCDALTREMDLHPNKIELIQNGVDTDRFTPGNPAPQLIARHNLYGKKVILTVGRLVPRKGVDMAIRSMSQVCRQIPNVHYLIVGDGEYRPTLSRLVDDHQLADYVTFAGKVTDDELLGYLRTCDVFLMPNRTMPDGDTEGFGLVFREANACRKPVIGGRAGGAVEAVIDENTGILVNGAEPMEIADAIIRLLSDLQLASLMSDNGYRLAQENNTKAVTTKFLMVCERLLREKTDKNRK